jgi:hypothetical protein
MRFLIGHASAADEPRSLVVAKELPTHMRVALGQTGAGNTLRFTIDNGESISSVAWDEFQSTMAKILHGATSIDVDITMLGSETIFHLVRYTIVAACPVTYRYVTPVSYSFVADPFQLHERSDICQLPGFMARPNSLEGIRQKHVVTLGFDKGRARKFVERYAWTPQDTRAVIVCPEFVDDGLSQALKAAEPWLDEFRKANEQIVAEVSLEPAAIAAFLIRMLNQCEFMDLVLLGPKSITLGAAIFCNSLSDRERLSVRILTDFATPLSSRSKGVGKQLSFKQADILASMRLALPSSDLSAISQNHPG